MGDKIDHVGIYGSRVADGLSAFNVGLVSIVAELLNKKIVFNSVWRIYTICRHKSGTLLAQIMFCSPMAPESKLTKHQ